MRDTELGLGPSAAIVATVHRVGIERAPRRAHGILRIFVDDTGRVLGALSTSPSWEAPALAMLRALEGRRFNLPSGAHVVTLAFAVEARYTHVPAVLTGEAEQYSPAWGEGLQGTSPSDRPYPVVLVPIDALLPVPRHPVSFTLLREERR